MRKNFKPWNSSIFKGGEYIIIQILRQNEIHKDEGGITLKATE